MFLEIVDIPQARGRQLHWSLPQSRTAVALSAGGVLRVVPPVLPCAEPRHCRVQTMPSDCRRRSRGYAR